MKSSEMLFDLADISSYNVPKKWCSISAGETKTCAPNLPAYPAKKYESVPFVNYLLLVTSKSKKKKTKLRRMSQSFNRVIDLLQITKTNKKF